MGDEGKLRHELLDAACGLSPRSNLWDRDQGADAYFKGTGSQNIWLMRWATQVLRGRAGAASLARAVYGYQLGISPVVMREGSVLAVTFIQPDDRIYPSGFGGSEFMSTIYWPWHVMSHVALTRAREPEISAWARRWVILNWVLFRAITAPDGSLMLFGQRSAGHAPFPREMDYIYALASGGDLKRAERWCKVMGAAINRSWEKEIAVELLPEMRETWEAALSIPIEELQNALPLRVPTEIIRTAEGIAVIHASNCNSNTPPILAGTCDVHGRRTILPTSIVKGKPIPGGIRIRQRFDHASARIEGDEIVYASSLYTRGEEVRIPIPGGDVLYHLKLGLTPPSEPGAGTDPGLPAPPISSLSWAADLLAGLKLAKRDQGARDAIVAAIRAGEDPTPFLDIIRKWFRPDSPQAQAAQWREALSILEASTEEAL